MLKTVKNTNNCNLFNNYKLIQLIENDQNTINRTLFSKLLFVYNVLLSPINMN